MADERGRIHQVLLAQAGDRGALDDLLKGIQAPLFAFLRGLVDDSHLRAGAN